MTAHNEYTASFRRERNIVFDQSKYLQQCCNSTKHIYLSLLHARRQRRRLRPRKILYYIFDFLSYSIIQTSTWTWRTKPQKLFDSMSVCSLYPSVWVSPFDTHILEVVVLQYVNRMTPSRLSAMTYVHHISFRILLADEIKLIILHITRRE